MGRQRAPKDHLDADDLEAIGVRTVDLRARFEPRQPNGRPRPYGPIAVYLPRSRSGLSMISVPQARQLLKELRAAIELAEAADPEADTELGGKA